jgi:citrate lyase beta subunit
VAKTSLSSDALGSIVGRLRSANFAFAERFPGEPTGRHPVHTVYGGAHLFKSDTAQKLGALALQAIEEYAADFGELARAIGLSGSERLGHTKDDIREVDAAMRASVDSVRRINPGAWLAHTIHGRVVDKLKTEPVEDLRLDFEDGYGIRTNAEEDGHAVEAAREMAKGLAAGTLPPFIGIRIKSLSEELRDRAIRTLDLFLTTLVRETGGRLPDNFVVTLPKITMPEQVAALADLLDHIEPALGVEGGTIKMEMMIEVTQSILGHDGSIALPRMLDAARGRCVTVHLGAYDYTASCNISATQQTMTHSACDFARHMMQVAYARTGLVLCDGASNILPVPIYRTAQGQRLSPEQVKENNRVVHRAWRTQYQNIQHSMTQGFYQGWDLHPAQIPVRYAAVYAFFLEGLDAASTRLKNFVEKAAQATLVGSVFDDEATGQGLLNFFLRALSSGAITEEEATRLTTLTSVELRSRSFRSILASRAGRGIPPPPPSSVGRGIPAPPISYRGR